MTLTQETLGQRLKEARLNIQMKQEAAANAIGLDRTALLKIEKGSRAVTGIELHKLARLYRRDTADFLTEEPMQEDPFTALGRINGNSEPEWDEHTWHYLELLKEAVQLEELLGSKIRVHPPVYQMASPESYFEAIEQGKELAVRERERLKLGSGPIVDVAELIASQGIWAVAVHLPDHVSGLFISHKRYGLAIFVNEKHARARRRFSYAHEYAHSLIDRDRRMPEASTRSNHSDFIEKRANAFASEFLIPGAGVYETLERMHKNSASRITTFMWDEAISELITHEDRIDPETHGITGLDVALLAHEYKVSYEVAAIRLKDIGAIRRPQLDVLLQQKDNALKFLQIEALGLYDPNGKDHVKDQPYLVRQVVLLALEAFRRGKISTGRFREVCRLADIPYEDLLPATQAGIKE